MRDIIWNILMDIKDSNPTDCEAETDKIMELFTLESKLATEFAEWVGTNYKQDNGSVIGNVYFERGGNLKGYNILELFEIFIK